MSSHAILQYYEASLSSVKVLAKHLGLSLGIRAELIQQANRLDKLWGVYKRKHHIFLIETQRQLHLLKSLTEKEPGCIQQVQLAEIGTLLSSLDTATSMLESLLSYSERADIHFIKSAMPVLENTLLNIRQDVCLLEKLLEKDQQEENVSSL